MHFLILLSEALAVGFVFGLVACADELVPRAEKIRQSRCVVILNGKEQCLACVFRGLESRLARLRGQRKLSVARQNQCEYCEGNAGEGSA